MSNESGSVSAFFDKQWDLYQRAVRNGVLCHAEMFATLDRFLAETFGNRPFSFVDFGCGDGSAALTTLKTKHLSHYIGVDAASEVIAGAVNTLKSLDCQKTLIAKNMAVAVHDLQSPVDVIFCSYSLHHLLLDQKIDFIGNCFKHLASPGYFVLVDGVKSEQETREQWLKRLDNRFVDIARFNDEDRAEIMKHPQDCDFPETISTFRNISQALPWHKFEVLFEKDDFLAFMVFTK
jgi:SAM-dependent methyltransferase